MKKYILYIIAIFAFAVSCTNDIDIPNGSLTDKSYATISIDLSDGSRTVNPELDLSSLTKFMLQGKKSDASTDLTNLFDATIDDVNILRNTRIKIETGAWQLRLTALSGSLSVVSTINPIITEDTTSLTFPMHLSSLGSQDQSGNINVTIIFNKPTAVSNAEDIAITATMYEGNDFGSADPINTNPITVTINGNTCTATYQLADVTVDTYIIVLEFKVHNLPVNTVRSIVNVASGLTSKATMNLGDLESIYPIGYILGDNTDLNPNIAPYYYSTRQELILPTADNISRPGYKFLGWSLGNDDQTVDKITQGSTGDITLTARWQPYKYEIQFSNYIAYQTFADGSMDSIWVDYDQTIDLKNDQRFECKFTRYGYSFKNWYFTEGSTETDLTRDIVKNLKTPTSEGQNTSLAVRWEPIQYNIHYTNVKPGTVAVINNNPAYYTIESDVTLDDLTCDCWQFEGWYMQPDSQTGGQSIKIKHLPYTTGGTNTQIELRDVTLDAHWKPVWGMNNGNFRYGDTTFDKTSLITVANSDVTIDGSDGYWSRYCDNSVDANYKGGFFSGRKVTLSPYSMGQFEVTQKLYCAVMDLTIDTTNNSNGFNKGVGDNFPMYNVNWYQAIAFCNKLSLLTNKRPCYKMKLGATDTNDVSDDYWLSLKHSTIQSSSGTGTTSSWDSYIITFDQSEDGYRLPTEAEWEFAARGSHISPWQYPWSGKFTQEGNKVSADLTSDPNLDMVANYLSSTTIRVGSKTDNNLSLFDMSGNVSEWCWDVYGDLTADTVTNPTGAGSTAGGQTGTSTEIKAVIRGGGINNNSTSNNNPIYKCCVSYRDSCQKSMVPTDTLTGFRIVRNGVVTNTNP